MKTSETQASLIKALCAATKAFGAVIKDRKADRYYYADLAAVHEATNKHLADNGLVIIQGGDGEEIVTRLYHESGEWVETRTPVIAGARLQGAQAYGSGATYARRYALLALLNLSTEDDDGAAASKPPAQRDSRSAQQHASTAAQAPIDPARDEYDKLCGIVEKITEHLPKTTPSALGAAIERAEPHIKRLADLHAKEPNAGWFNLHEIAQGAVMAAKERQKAAAVDMWTTEGASL